MGLRIKRQGYYWPTMVVGYEDYSQKCDNDQRYASHIHQPAETLLTVSAPYPFMRWSMDILGPIQKSSRISYCWSLSIMSQNG